MSMTRTLSALSTYGWRRSQTWPGVNDVSTIQVESTLPPGPELLDLVVELDVLLLRAVQVECSIEFCPSVGH